MVSPVGGTSLAWCLGLKGGVLCVFQLFLGVLVCRRLRRQGLEGGQWACIGTGRNQPKKTVGAHKNKQRGGTAWAALAGGRVLSMANPVETRFSHSLAPTSTPTYVSKEHEHDGSAVGNLQWSATGRGGSGTDRVVSQARQVILKS